LWDYEASKHSSAFVWHSLKCCRNCLSYRPPFETVWVLQDTSWQHQQSKKIVFIHLYLKKKILDMWKNYEFLTEVTRVRSRVKSPHAENSKGRCKSWSENISNCFLLSLPGFIDNNWLTKTAVFFPWRCINHAIRLWNDNYKSRPSLKTHRIILNMQRKSNYFKYYLKSRNESFKRLKSLLKLSYCYIIVNCINIFPIYKEHNSLYMCKYRLK